MIDALIHEWHESAMAIASPELAAAFSAETDEVPRQTSKSCTHTVIRAKSQECV